jgi:choline-glycine betaine transporter
MQTILSIAVACVLLTSLLLVLRWGSMILHGEMPTRFFAFFAILFTSGLDVGLIIFPLTEFPVYETEAVYDFTNPLGHCLRFLGISDLAFLLRDHILLLHSGTAPQAI